jgi:hypothetical protein
MNNILPLFPLKLVAFPGEDLHLHIFEPRYKQLIRDVLGEERVFGIPVYINDIHEYGTTVKIDEISKEYEDGNMDIKAIGQKIFRIKKLFNPVEGKQYAGGLIEFVDSIKNEDRYLSEEIRSKLEKLLSDINIHKTIIIKPDISIYKIAHIIGLSIEEEYQFLKFQSDLQRQLFIISQLEKLEPEVEKVKEMKRRVMGNGHFKHLDALDF